jgi:large subunit ribosomal protein L21
MSYIFKSMKYAVITAGGKQYKVVKGQVLEIDKIIAEPGSNYVLDKVLLTVDGETINIGSPYLSNATVTAKVLEQVQGDKIRIAKFKAKARYRKVQGFRAQLTKVEIMDMVNKVEKKTAPQK